MTDSKAAGRPTTTPTSPTQDEDPGFDTYDFDNDPAFRFGLTSITKTMEGKPDSEIQEAIDKAKRFYYKSFIKTYNLMTYINDITNPSSSTTTTIPAPSTTTPILPPSSTSTSTSESKQNQEQPVYPKSFAEICEMVARGEKIPGVREIPSTLHGVNEASIPKMKPRAKPWEAAGGATTSPAAASNTGGNAIVSVGVGVSDSVGGGSLGNNGEVLDASASSAAEK
ncbi:hypothetical protein HDU76_004087 [Blyttiomyces sp. JEL0837]|nr:hypothetical protein HDU76_004087 [Blyttiomyces sp. JEL0837]